MEIVYAGIIIFVAIFSMALLHCFLNWLMKEDTKIVNSLGAPRKLTHKECVWLADYFHNKDECPDDDGYVGRYVLPKEVMKVYKQKYAKERKW